MKYWMYVVGIVFLIGVVKGCNGIDDKKGEVKVIEQEILALMRKLDTLDEPSRMKLVSQVDEQRNELLGVLLKHLGTSESKNVQTAAIYLIGRHRLSDGVAQLIHCIDFDTGGQPQFSALPLWERYPAMEALIAIGWPSIPAAIELLAMDTDDVRRDLAVKVIRYITDGEIAKFILERAWTNESEPSRKTNLQDALVRLEKLPR